MSDDHIQRNRASRERLASVIARLGERTVVLPDGWTAAALLGHLAFWDRFAATRLEKYLRDREPMVFLNDALIEFINAAGLPQWTATPLSAAAAGATDSAAAADLLIAKLSADELAAISTVGSPRLLDRSGHRNEHLDQLERALE
jgi:DinB family protein